MMMSSAPLTLARWHLLSETFTSAGSLRRSTYANTIKVSGKILKTNQHTGNGIIKIKLVQMSTHFALDHHTDVGRVHIDVNERTI
jgi:hypothetical protein